MAALAIGCRRAITAAPCCPVACRAPCGQHFSRQCPGRRKAAPARASNQEEPQRGQQQEVASVAEPKEQSVEALLQERAELLRQMQAFAQRELELRQQVAMQQQRIRTLERDNAKLETDKADLEQESAQELAELSRALTVARARGQDSAELELSNGAGQMLLTSCGIQDLRPSTCTLFTDMYTGGGINVLARVAKAVGGQHDLQLFAGDANLLVGGRNTDIHPPSLADMDKLARKLAGHLALYPALEEKRKLASAIVRAYLDSKSGFRDLVIAGDKAAKAARAKKAKEAK